MLCVKRHNVSVQFLCCFLVSFHNMTRIKWLRLLLTFFPSENEFRGQLLNQRWTRGDRISSWENRRIKKIKVWHFWCVIYRVITLKNKQAAYFSFPSSPRHQTRICIFSSSLFLTLPCHFPVLYFTFPPLILHFDWMCIVNLALTKHLNGFGATLWI